MSNGSCAEPAVDSVDLATTGSGKMTDEETMRGRVVHAEARAAAAEHREALVTLQALMNTPEIRKAKELLARREASLDRALQADREFRAEVGQRLGLDMSDPGAVEVDWETQNITVGK